MKPSAGSWLVLAGFILLTFAAAGIGGLATGPAVSSWYPSISKPSWTPPSWLFGPVWTLLYTMMGVAAWRVWRKAGFSGTRAALFLFAVQLVLNAAWSWFFFGWRLFGAAAVEIALLWLAILLTLLAFRRIDRPAAWLFVPYLLWVTFAAVLNVAIWRLNN